MRILRIFLKDCTVLTNHGTLTEVAIVKNLIELMNGKIEVTSNEKDGTIFTVMLPK